MTVRKNANKMKANEKKRFKDIVKKLIDNGTYGKFVSFHADMSHMMHGSMGMVGRQRFLPWHRMYLLKLEQEMQSVDPLSFIPYWDWTTSKKIPVMLKNFMPTVNVPGRGNITVSRNVGTPTHLPTKSDIKSVLSEDTYTLFTTQLEFSHNNVHGWVGGIMFDIQYSPTDPVFWLHHAQIDRIWSMWQNNPQNTGKNPSLSGNDRTMDPWIETESQTRSITALGYSYS